MFSSILVINECQELHDAINSARNTYNSNANNGNCLAYQSALNNYLNSSCEDNDYITYSALYQNELDSLDCLNLPSCTDGIQNGDETGVDCGGSCAPCGSGATCSDGVQNGNETGVDCGGDCPPCTVFTGDMAVVGDYTYEITYRTNCNNSTSNGSIDCTPDYDCGYLKFKSDGSGYEYDVDPSTGDTSIIYDFNWNTSGTDLIFLLAPDPDETYEYSVTTTHLQFTEYNFQGGVLDGCDIETNMLRL